MIRISYYQKGGWWYAQIYINGKRIQKAMGVKTAKRKMPPPEVKDRGALLERHLLLQEYGLQGNRAAQGPPEPSMATIGIATISLGDCIEKYLAFKRATGIKGSTADNYTNQLRNMAAHLGANLPLGLLATRSYEEFLQTIPNKSTAKHASIVANGLWRWAKNQGYACNVDSVTSGKISKRTMFLGDRELEELEQALVALRVAHKKTAFRYCAYFMMCLHAGMRIGEASSVTEDQISVVSGIPILTLSASQTKNKTSRYVVLSDTLEQALREAFAMGVMQKAPERENIPPWVQAALSFRLRFHDLRRTHAVLLRSMGAPDSIIREQLGHTDPSALAHYLPPNLTQNKTLVDQIKWNPWKTMTE